MDEEIKGTDNPQGKNEELEPGVMPASEEEETPKEKTQEELSLPDGVSERTREQFEKLKNLLRQERQEKQELLKQLNIGSSPQAPNIFEAFRPQGYQPPTGGYEYLTPQQVGQITSQFVDAEGNVDVAGLNAALQQANQAAAEAIQRARQAEERVARFEETQQTKEAYAVFPELDPLNKEKFDSTFFDLVRDRLLRNMYEGKSETLLEVARKIRQVYTPPTKIEEAKKEAVGEFQKSQAARQQGPLETGRGETRQTEGDLADLRRRTRQGDDKALEARLRSLGIIE